MLENTCILSSPGSSTDPLGLTLLVSNILNHCDYFISLGNSLVVQRLELHAFTAKGLGWRTKIPQATWLGIHTHTHTHTLILIVVLITKKDYFLWSLFIFYYLKFYQFSTIYLGLYYQVNINKYWSRKWQTTPVFLPGKFHGQRSLEGYSP